MNYITPIEDKNSKLLCFDFIHITEYSGLMVDDLAKKRPRLKYTWGGLDCPLSANKHPGNSLGIFIECAQCKSSELAAAMQSFSEVIDVNAG